MARLLWRVAGGGGGVAADGGGRKQKLKAGNLKSGSGALRWSLGEDTTALTAHRPPDLLKVVIAKRFFPRARGLSR